MKLWKILIVCLFSSFLLTGCWDRKDPEDRAFFITIGADTAGPVKRDTAFLLPRLERRRAQSRSA